VNQNVAAGAFVQVNSVIPQIHKNDACFPPFPSPLVHTVAAQYTCGFQVRKIRGPELHGVYRPLFLGGNLKDFA
jgi:hypothetical protein